MTVSSRYIDEIAVLTPDQAICFATACQRRARSSDGAHYMEMANAATERNDLINAVYHVARVSWSERSKLGAWYAQEEDRAQLAHLRSMRGSDDVPEYQRPMTGDAP